MPSRELVALQAWRSFATALTVTWGGRQRTWADHIKGSGYVDEEKVVQPTAFPRFAETILDFTVNDNLAPEESGIEGRPDFTPADSVTHPFVFEIKSTYDGVELSGHSEQVHRYLTEGRPRIKQVVLTNLVAIRVFDLEGGYSREQQAINLRALLIGDEHTAATTGDARRFADFIDRFRRQELTTAQKLERVRHAPPWNPPFEVTSSSWILGRLDKIVGILTENVLFDIKAGALIDPSRVNEPERNAISEELTVLSLRLGAASNNQSIAHFIDAVDGSPQHKALVQYCSHVAYYFATRLVLIRTWEDLGLLQSMLYDGGFDDQMARCNDEVLDVIDHSFSKARSRYRSLFDTTNSYTWFKPTEATYIEVIYQLANTYFGAIESDILGQVYERILERIDRKLLGQYYTPRDVISLIWDAIDPTPLIEHAEDGERQLRVLDIATGSGGFLVEIASRLRRRFDTQQKAGAAVEVGKWIVGVSESLNGVEYQRFSAYLAELNLLVQLGHVLASNPDVRVPPMGIVWADTLSLHEPDVTLGLQVEHMQPSSLNLLGESERAKKLKDVHGHDFLMDIACGNPPYIGEKTGAGIMQLTRARYPYWEQYIGQHMDYLYWFLILGISKLRQGGRFGFITTEYWLRSIGAKALRRYLAERCRIERMMLFRNMKLFPDAPGQHSMIIIGERIVPAEAEFTGHQLRGVAKIRPVVSIYGGKAISGAMRTEALRAFRDAASRAGVRSFTASVSPNQLGDDSWSEVVLTRSQYQRRQRLRGHVSVIDVDTDEGVLSSADRMRHGYDEYLTQGTLRAIGWPDQRAGIFSLNPKEVAALGTLSKREKELLRPIINTRDVLPYASILPAEAECMIYLSPFDANGKKFDMLPGSVPSDLPNFRRHLMQFRPLLEAKVLRYNEQRPWWVLHRPRPALISRDVTSGWGEYCLISRWGIGQRLIVGLPLAGTVPASGLTALLPPREVPAAYLCGLLNCTLLQQMAETLPPGKITAIDICELSPPLIPDQVAHVTEVTQKLAHHVNEMSKRYFPRFPALRDNLVSDLTLDIVSDGYWMPEVGSTSAWGELSRSNWVTDVSRRGSGSSRIKVVSTSDDLLGTNVYVTGQGHANIRIGITHGSDGVADALVSYIRGVGLVGGVLSDVARLMVPIRRELLVEAAAADHAALSEIVEKYRGLRGEIDSAVGDEL